MGGKVTPMRGKDHLVACVCNGAVHRLYIEVASAMHRPLGKIYSWERKCSFFLVRAKVLFINSDKYPGLVGVMAVLSY